MSDATKGLLAMVLACIIWGLSPLYYALLKQVPPLDVFCYRALWSMVFFGCILVIQKRLHLVASALTGRQFWLIAVAALLISANWFGFIFAIQIGKAMEASLGYYIFPLVAVVLGRFLYAETLMPTQWVAILLAGVAVIVLSAGLGIPPWIALGLAGTFAAYGVIKKLLPLGPVVSVMAEVVLIAPTAAGWLLLVGAPGSVSWQNHALLALSGPLTATPLVLFSYAARRARMSTVGIIQYINPTLQFGCAVLVLGEAFTSWHGIAFPMIWAALAIYSIAVLRQDRLARKATSSDGTSATTLT